MAETIAKVREQEVAWNERRSPKGKYQGALRPVSSALNAMPKLPPESNGEDVARPFEVDLFRIPPGKRPFPLHSHSAQWEYYIIVSGRGLMVQMGDEVIELRPGDHVSQPPGWAHTLENTGDEDLVYYVIADNPTGENCYYPDSDKWVTRPPRRVFYAREVDYFDGEE